MKQHFNHTLGIALILPLLLFFFYKSIISTGAFEEHAELADDIETLQVKLHRDILRYRNNQVRQYDTLNDTVAQISDLSERISVPDGTDRTSELAQQLTTLKSSIDEQSALIEDFKTGNSVLQNSLYYFSRLHSEIRANGNKAVSAELFGKLSVLILEYTRKPEHETALKIFPLLDELNAGQDAELNTLINHSLIIIDRLPFIDRIIEDFNTLAIEKQIKNMHKLVAILEDNGHHVTMIKVRNPGYIVYEDENQVVAESFNELRE